MSYRQRLFNKATEDEDVAYYNPSAPYLVPFVTLMSLLMISKAFIASFDYAYPLRVAGVAVALAVFRRDYSSWPRSWSWPAVLTGVLIFAVWLALEPKPGGATALGLPSDLSALPSTWVVLWIVLRVMGSVVTVPIAEELAFRGFLSRRIDSVNFDEVRLGQFTWWSFAVSSLLFGLLHGRWIAGTLAGAAYTLILRHRGQLSDAVLAHATTNALIAAYVLITGNWSFWL
jgi:CAAX prenyl protease-like protein